MPAPPPLSDPAIVSAIAVSVTAAFCSSRSYRLEVTESGEPVILPFPSPELTRIRFDGLAEKSASQLESTPTVM